MVDQFSLDGRESIGSGPYHSATREDRDSRWTRTVRDGLRLGLGRDWFASPAIPIWPPKSEVRKPPFASDLVRVVGRRMGIMSFMPMIMLHVLILIPTLS